MSVSAPAAPAPRQWTTRPMAVHLVGTAPLGTGGHPLSTMQWHLDHQHGVPLTALPFDADDRWIIDWLEAREQVPGLVKVHSGASLGYDDLSYYAIGDGHVLSPADVALGRVEQTAEAFASLEQLQDGSNIPERLQVSIPNALDLAFFVSGSVEASAEWIGDMQAMLVGEIAELAGRWGDRVQLQLESPAILLAYHRTPREDWPLLTGELTGQVAATLAAAPSAKWVLHLCYGDLEHEPLFEPSDLTAPVTFLNALADLLDTRGVPMPLVHLPIAHGSAAPATDPAFYAALRELRRGVEVIAGVVDESHPEATRLAFALLIDALGGPVTALGASCGLGRRSAVAGAANTALASSVARAWTTTSAR
ncbi:hypothetical protein [Amycolatopsis saalfeldensis]|uniref:5-methyltetrahydropteroyltriglutamate--homocysteine methyltransferase n=1 Tax=Amycolatopsis saalfeldensis TaxID=394193 RepID=A0A1H8YPM5_9PSEU|nr:hypothetical protein [Amycolatopsis saalfeldensis]SEP53992.1 hypothetical protein SAMN04489732_13447 [Amycolatopsis saalfeldensis]